jgi:hypothetical protein
MRIADGKITSRGLNAALRATDGQERSAALPSGEGVAALLGVLAGSSGSTLKHYWRWAPFRAGQRQTLAANLRANLFATRSFAHPVFRLLAAHLRLDHLWTHLLSAGRLPNSSTASCVFSLSYKPAQMDSCIIAAHCASKEQNGRFVIART